ncbi:MAG: leucine-rich repeat domain-containing protein, partial [Ruminococcus sp.]|nr:leucine-rich repeat domain-containing protein [Ruminococcus sp.]
MLKRLMSGVLSLVMLGTMFPSVKTAEKTQPVVQQGENPVSSPMDYQISSTNSLGNYINDMVGKQNMLNTSAAEVPQDERFMVNNLEFDNVTGKLTVKSTQTSDSSVVIRINDEESGKTIIEKSAEAASGESVATVFDIDKTKLSEFYIISAVLVDEKGNEICKAFEYKKYTKEIQKVIASDIHDFKEEQVIQLDKSEDTNFVVLSEDTIKAESNAEKNVLLSADYDNGVFVFENPDDTIRNLKSGESFYIQPNENDVITIIVGTVEINGNQATLRASDEPIDDMFDFIKLEATSDQSGMIVDTSKADESLQFDSFENDGLVHELDSCGPITFEAWLALDGTVEGSDKFTVKKPDDVSTGDWLLDHLSGSVEIGFELSYYKSFTETMIDFELKSTSSLTVEVGLSTEDLPDGNPTIDLPGFSIPTPIPGIVVDISPCIEFSLEGSISVSFSQEAMVGFTYDNGSFTAKSDKDEGSMEVKAEGSASVMLNFEVDLAVIDDEIASVGLTFGLGLKFEAETGDVGYRNYVRSSSSSGKVDILSGCGDDSIHACDFEIEGTWSFVIGASLEAEIVGLSREAGLEFPIEIGKAYFSSRSGFGWGECDYYKHRIEIYVDPGESEYENAVVKLDGLACNLYSLPNTAVFYGLNTGSSSGYSYSVVSDGKTLKTGSIRVNNASQRLTINLDNGSTGSSVGPTVTTTAKVSAPKIPSTVIATAPKPDIPRILEVGTLGDNISYTLYETGELWVYGYGDMKDFSSSPFKNPDKVKKVSFEHKNPKKNLYITSIGNRVFYNCNNLPEIVIPDTVTRIGDYAFSGCSALQFGNLVLSSKITYVGAYAFNGCAGLISIEVPGTVKTIGDYAFGDCTGLKSAVLKDGIGSIGEYIFNRC